MASQKTKNPNTDHGIYDECKSYFNKVGQETFINDDYNFSAGDYSEDIETDFESPTSILSSRAVGPNQYVKIHQNLTPIEPYETVTQNPSEKIMQEINSQRHYLPNHTTITSSPKCPPPPADVTEIYRRHYKKNKVTNPVMSQHAQRPPIMVLSGAPNSVLDQTLQSQYCQQQPHVVLRCVPTRADDEQHVYVTNNSRNYPCCYCKTELVTPIHKQQQPSTKRYLQHCVAVESADPVIEYYEDDLVDDYSDDIEYNDTPCDIVPTSAYHRQQQQNSKYHQYLCSSPQLQGMRDVPRPFTTVTNGVNSDVNSTRNVLQTPPKSSNTVTVKSAIRGLSPINGGSSNGICSGNNVDSYNIPTRLHNNSGNNIQHRCKISREYASLHAPFSVGGNGNNTDHIPASMRPHTTPGDVIQTSQVHYHVTPHPSHRQRQRTTVLAPRYYKRANVSGSALYKPPSKLCLPVFSQPEYPSFIATAHRKHRGRNNRTLQPQQCVVETMNVKNDRERVEYESSPAYYTTADYNVIQEKRCASHPKRKLKNKLLTLINPKRSDTNNTPTCDMDGLLAHFETLFDIKEKKYTGELSSSKDNVNGIDKTVSPSVKSVKCTPSQTALKRSRISSLLIKSKQDKLKNITKLNKSDSTMSQQTINSKTRIKRKHDKTNSSKTNSSEINNSNNNYNNENKNNDNDEADDNNIIDDIPLNNTTSTPKDVLSPVAVDLQQQKQSQYPFSNEMNSDSLDNLLADLMASGYINQKQHDKSKSINQKMREETQKIFNTQSICCSPPQATPKKRQIELSHSNHMVDGENHSINSCVGSTDNTSDSEIVNSDSKINNTVIPSIHDSNNSSSIANKNDEHGIFMTTDVIASMSMLSPSNKDIDHTIISNDTSYINANDTSKDMPRNDNSIYLPEVSQTLSLKLSKSEKTKSYSHISSQTSNVETKDSINSLTKLTMNNSNCETKNSKSNILQMNIPLSSTISVNKQNGNTQHCEDRTVAVELHRSKSYIIKLIDRALSKELGTAPEPRLTVESPSTINRQHVVPNTINDVNKNKTENFSQLMSSAAICPTTTNTKTEISEESKSSMSSFEVNAEEASCLKQLKLLRWSHLKHIQEEVQRLQDLERFLDSCNTSNPK